MVKHSPQILASEEKATTTTTLPQPPSRPLSLKRSVTTSPKHPQECRPSAMPLQRLLAVQQVSQQRNGDLVGGLVSHCGGPVGLFRVCAPRCPLPFFVRDSYIYFGYHVLMQSGTIDLQALRE